MAPETTAKVASNAITKGDVLGAARIAGIQAAKKTPDLIPMCRPLLVGGIHVNFTIGDNFVEVEAQVETVDRHRGRDGSSHRVHGGGPYHLRHVQVGGSLHERRGVGAVGEDRR